MTKLRNIGLLNAALLITLACSSSPSGEKAGRNKGSGGTSNIVTASGGNGEGAVSGEGGSREVPFGGKILTADAYGLVPLTDAYAGGLGELLDTACQGETVETEPEPVELQLVVDTSSSMNRPAPNTQDGRNKWEITRDALSVAMGSLPPNAAAGVTFFPNEATVPNPNGPALADPPPCVNQGQNVPIDLLGQPGSVQRGLIDIALFGIGIPESGAGTPTHDAYAVALPPLQAANLPADQKFMLLITDGQPTFSRGCLGWGAAEYEVDPAPIVAEIAAAYAGGAGIRTFVIGSPGSELSTTNKDGRPWLSDAAQAGGTGTPGCASTGPTYCHFDMSTQSDFSAGLADALRVIASTIVSCNYVVQPTADGLPIDPAKVNIVFTEGGSGAAAGEATEYLIARNDASDCPNGWRFADPTVTNAADQPIEICGATCDKIKSDPKAKINLVYGCKEIATVQ